MSLRVIPFLEWGFPARHHNVWTMHFCELSYQRDLDEPNHWITIALLGVGIHVIIEEEHA